MKRGSDEVNELLTAHCCIHPAYICQQSQHCEIGGEDGRSRHGIFERFGSLRRMHDCIHIEVAKRDLAAKRATEGRGIGIGEDTLVIAENVEEEVVLEVDARQRIAVGALDGERLLGERALLARHYQLVMERRSWWRSQGFPRRPVCDPLMSANQPATGQLIRSELSRTPVLGRTVSNTTAF